MKTSAAITALGALAQETRLSIFRLLVRHAPRGLPAGTIARRLRLPGPTLSFHLNVLAAAELERGRFIHLDGPSGRTRHLNLQEILPAGTDRARISGIDVPEFPEPTPVHGELLI